MKKKLFLFILIIISFLTIKNVYAETYDGEHSIEYLLKNYSVVTLGQKEIYLGTGPGYNGYTFNKGDLYYKYDSYNNIIVDQPVLVSGNVQTSEDTSTSTIYTTKIGYSGTKKSFVKGNISNYVEFSSRSTDSNYLNFTKMYEEVTKESQTIANNTEYYINSANIEISKPGIYTIQNTASFMHDNNGYNTEINTLLIKNYDRNSIYVFNYYNEFIYSNSLPNIMIMENSSSNSVYLTDYINSGNYTGNIIFNFPNAKIINIDYYLQMYGMWSNCRRTKCEGFNGNIVAPNADVYISRLLNSDYYGTIIANSVWIESNPNIKKANYKLDKKIVEADSYIIKAKDCDGDFYSRDYSIKDLLENYSLITLGHKQISSKAKLSRLTNRNGSVRLFHITGQALINGDMVYDNPDLISAFDLQSNKVTESYINGNNAIYSSGGGYTVIQPWDNMSNDNITYIYQKNSLFVDSHYESGQSRPFTFPINLTNVAGLFTAYFYNYINFDRLYDNIVAEQSAIEEGQVLLVGDDGVLHIPTGGIYTIKDISNVEEIVFDNFEKNKDELTIITIKNDGDINFPLVSKDGNGYKGIITNDYFGKDEATHLYEFDTFLSEDSYYGNIVWNLPSAEFIQLKEDAPFAGHMIAPNADVETPEIHFAGCFIVNSIYGEGNTEAHFYPINSDLRCVSSEYDKLSDTQKKRFNDYRLRKSLGRDNTIIEKEIIGDEEQYNKDIELFESLIIKCENREIIINPETAGTIGILLAIIAIAFTTLTIKTKKKAN